MEETQKTNKWRTLFDLNIILDVLMLREPYFTDGARLWSLVENNEIEGFLAAHSFTTLFYLYKRQKSSEEAYQVIGKLLQVFDVAGVDRHVIELACDLGWKDFEDAVQAVAASGVNCDYLITRNPGDYSAQQATAIQPADFLAVWAGQVKSNDIEHE